MVKVDIRKEQAEIKMRICQDLKRLGITKLSVAVKSGFHYNTVKRYLNHEIQGWSSDLISATEKIINEASINKPCE